MDRWLNSAAGRRLFRLIFHLSIWGNLGAFLAIFLYDKLGVPNSYFGVLVIVVILFGFPGSVALFAFLVGMLLCVASSRRLHWPKKVLWCLGFLAFNVLALSVHYFVIYRREAQQLEAKPA